MRNTKYAIILALAAIPLLAAFTYNFLGITLGFLWGFVGWLLAVNLLAEKQQKQSIKSDTFLQQLKPQEPDPQRVVEEIMENAEESAKSEKKYNPFSSTRE